MLKFAKQLALLCQLLLEMSILHSNDLDSHLRWQSISAASTLTAAFVHALVDTAEGPFAELVAPLDGHELELSLLINLNRRHRQFLRIFTLTYLLFFQRLTRLLQ